MQLLKSLLNSWGLGQTRSEKSFQETLSYYDQPDMHHRLLRDSRASLMLVEHFVFKQVDQVNRRCNAAQDLCTKLHHSLSVSKGEASPAASDVAFVGR